MSWTTEQITEYVSRPCCNHCKKGSFEEAYHKLQRAPDRMSDDQIMFEAGKLAAKIQRDFDIKKKVSDAVKQAVSKVMEAK